MTEDEIKIKSHEYAMDKIKSVMSSSKTFVIPSEKDCISGVTIVNASQEKITVTSWFECDNGEGDMGKHEFSMDIITMGDWLAGGSTLMEYQNIKIDGVSIP